MIKNGLGTLEKHWERTPFYSNSKNGRWLKNGPALWKVDVARLCAGPPSAHLGWAGFASETLSY
jgi:hypothetical protein